MPRSGFGQCGGWLGVGDSGFEVEGEVGEAQEEAGVDFLGHRQLHAASWSASTQARVCQAAWSRWRWGRVLVGRALAHFWQRFL